MKNVKSKLFRVLTPILMVALMVVSLIAVFDMPVEAAIYDTVNSISDGTYVITFTKNSVNYALSSISGDWITINNSENDWTLNENVLTTNKDNLVWEIQSVIVNEIQYYTIKNTSDKTYLQWTAGTNKITAVSEIADNCYWKIQIDTTTNIVSFSFVSTDESVILSAYNTSGCKAYKTSSATTKSYTTVFQLYRLNTSIEDPCENGHSDTDGNNLCDNCNCCMGHNYIQKENSLVPATCINSGSYDVYCEYCLDVGDLVEIPPLYHKYGADGKCERTDCTAEMPFAIGNTVHIVYHDDTTKYEFGGVNSEEIGICTEYTDMPSKYPLKVEQGITSDYTTVLLKTVSGKYLAHTGAATANKIYEYEKGSLDDIYYSWIPFVDENGSFKLINAGAPERELQYYYNNGSPRFACYTGKQKSVSVVVVPDVPTASFGITLNKGVTVKVTCNISAEWIEYYSGAKLVFKNGEAELKSFTPIEGKNAYTIDLTPANITDALSFHIVPVDATVKSYDVSVSNYKTMLSAYESTPSVLGLDADKYAKLVTLLDAIITYGQAANKTYSGTLSEDFEGVEAAVLTDPFNLFMTLSGKLDEGASINIPVFLDNLLDTHIMTVKLGDTVLVSDVTLKNYVNSNGDVVISGIFPANFNDTITITVSDTAAPGQSAEATFSFNSYLKTVYGACSDDTEMQTLIAAAYLYGVAAENYKA